MTNETKGITVKIDAGLHAEIRKYLEDNNMTMAEFITRAANDELHPKYNVQEVNMAEKMRTLAFQVPDSLFQRIKEYLSRTGMSQKNFVVGLIEEELDRDEEMRAANVPLEEQNKDPEESGQNETAGAVGEEVADAPIYMAEDQELATGDTLYSEVDATDEGEVVDEYIEITDGPEYDSEEADDPLYFSDGSEDPYDEDDSDEDEYDEADEYDAEYDEEESADYEGEENDSPSFAMSM